MTTSDPQLQDSNMSTFTSCRVSAACFYGNGSFHCTVLGEGVQEMSRADCKFFILHLHFIKSEIEVENSWLKLLV